MSVLILTEYAKDPNAHKRDSAVMPLLERTVREEQDLQRRITKAVKVERGSDARLLIAQYTINNVLALNPVHRTPFLKALVREVARFFPDNIPSFWKDAIARPTFYDRWALEMYPGDTSVVTVGGIDERATHDSEQAYRDHVSEPVSADHSV